MRNLLNILTALCFAASVAQAEPWKEALHSGSPRLAFYSLNAARPAGSEELLVHLLNRQGGISTSDPMLDRSVSARPLAYYDANVNGGIPNDQITIAGVPFTVNEDSRAKSDFVLGAQLAGRLSYRVAPRNVVRLDGSLALSRSVEYGNSEATATARACLLSHIATWTWVDTCAGHTEFSGSNDFSEDFVSADVEQAFNAFGADHIVGTGLRFATRDDYDKGFLSFKTISAIGGIGAITTNTSISNEVEGENTTVFSFRSGLSREILGERTVLSASFARTAGTSIFGAAREDDIYGLSVSRNLREQFGVTLGVRETVSSVSAFDSTEFSLSFSVRSWDFD